jgi:hypothetical protein
LVCGGSPQQKHPENEEKQLKGDGLAETPNEKIKFAQAGGRH